MRAGVGRVALVPEMLPACYHSQPNQPDTAEQCFPVSASKPGLTVRLRLARLG